MAVIGSIQKRAYILVFIIALALISFLFLDFSNLGSSLAGGDRFVGKIDGKELSYEEFNKLLEEKEQLYKLSSGKENINEAERASIKAEVWSNNFVKPALINKLKEGGLVITPDELVEITTGTNISPALMQAKLFLDNRGQYDPIKFKNFLKTINQDDPNTPRGTRKKQWIEFEEQIKEVRIANKFNKLISNSQYVPKWMADYEQSLVNINSDISYVKIPLSSIATKDINVDDKEMEEFFNKNKNRYKQFPEVVFLKHVAFSLKPSPQDSTAIWTSFAEKVQDMKASKNDTNFFKAYGDNGFDTKFYSFNELRQTNKVTEIMESSPNTIIGPYIEGDNLKAIKVLRKRMIADSVQVKALTISFKDVLNNQEAVNSRWKLVDSVFKILDTLNGNFDQACATYSVDRGQSPALWVNSKMNDINPEVFTEGGNRRYFKSPSNSEGVVRILKVLRFPANKLGVQFGTTSVPYVPSSETQNEIYNQAMKFKEDCKSSNDLQSLAKKYPRANFLSTNATKDLTTLDGVDGNARDAIRWAFNSETGKVSNILQIGSNYVICGNSGKATMDEPKFKDVKNLVKEDFIAEKRISLLKAKLAGNSLEEIASKNTTEIKSISDFNYNNSSIDNKPENSLVAATKFMNEGSISKPIKGLDGVYVLKINKKNKKELEASDILNIKMNLNRSIKNIFGVLESMIENLGIEDNRVNMF